MQVLQSLKSKDKKGLTPIKPEPKSHRTPRQKTAETNVSSKTLRNFVRKSSIAAKITYAREPRLREQAAKFAQETVKEQRPVFLPDLFAWC